MELPALKAGKPRSSFARSGRHHLYDYDEEYTKKLIGPDWKKYIADSFKEFKAENRDKFKSEELMKAEFQEQNLNAFYVSMDEIFRDGFGTGSETAKKATNWFAGLLFGKDE